MEEHKLIPLDPSLLSEEVIDVLLLDSTSDPSFFEEIARKNTHRPEVLRRLLDHPNTPETAREFSAQALQTPVPAIKRREPTAEPSPEQTAGRTQTLLRRIQSLKIGEKIQLAFRGSREIRSILIRDSNKEVMLSVLENPKITEHEIELLVKQRTSSEDVIRAIAKKKEWLRNYSIVHAVVTNPKTPLASALKYLPRLRLKELQLLEKDKNTSSALRAMAKKLLSARKSL